MCCPAAKAGLCWTFAEAVAEAFVQLHERGLIYKGSYLVNWSPNLQTAVSDLEVKPSDPIWGLSAALRLGQGAVALTEQHNAARTGKASTKSCMSTQVEYSEEPGSMFYFRYPIAGGGPEDFLPVATTRPETILGDTAVAVHPEDPRFAQFIGKECSVPFTDRCYHMPNQSQRVCADRGCQKTVKTAHALL